MGKAATPVPTRQSALPATGLRPVTDTADPSDPPPLEPTRPEDYECCGNGCEPCVFDLHAQAVDRWRIEMKAWRARQAGQTAPAAARAEVPAADAPPATAVPALCRPTP